MSTVPPNPPTPGGAAPAPPAVPVPQKSSGVKILLWVLGIILGLILLSFASCTAILFYARHKMTQAGFSSELMKKNPGYAGAKMAVTMNPEVEIVSSDDDTGTIVVREKKTGKVVTMKFDPNKKAMTIIDENGKTATMTVSGEGSSANMEIKGPDGTVKIGESTDKAPDWVPVYPGSSPKNTFSASNGGEQSGTYAFVTADSADKLISFYKDALKSGGFAVSNMTNNSDGKVGGMVSGEDKVNKRNIVVGLETETDGTHVNVTYTVKP
jgi:hypothetical protein